MKKLNLDVVKNLYPLIIEKISLVNYNIDILKSVIY